jgi:hypothetical protein
MRQLVMILILVHSSSFGRNFKPDFIDKLNVSRLSDLKAGAISEKIRIDGIYTRDLDFGYSQSIISIIKWTPKKSVFFKYVVISKSDSILFGRLYREKVEFIELSQISNVVIKTNQLNDFLLKHNSFYKTNFTQNELINSISNLIMVGFSCGIGGNPNKEAMILKTLLSERDKEILTKWLKTPNIEIQFYAVTGLSYMEKNGEPLTDEQKMLMQHILNRDTKVYYCSGCIEYGPLRTAKQLIEMAEGQISYWINR